MKAQPATRARPPRTRGVVLSVPEMLELDWATPEFPPTWEDFASARRRFLAQFEPPLAATTDAVTPRHDDPGPPAL